MKNQISIHIHASLDVKIMVVQCCAGSFKPKLMFAKMCAVLIFFNFIHDNLIKMYKTVT